MSPIAITIGSFSIYWYSICILLAFIIGYFLTIRECRRRGIDEKVINDLFCYLIPVCIIGARLYFVVFDFAAYKDNLIDIFKIWNGGLAIHGGILFGLIFIIYYTKKHHINTIKFLDIAAVSLIIGQAIGRWGNFFNQEAHGPSTTLSFLQDLHLPDFIIDGMNIGGVYYHPTFLYESIICLLGFLILLLVRSLKKSRNGQMIGIYCIVYGLGRFFIEALREDSLMFLNLKVAQLVSLIMVLIGIVLVVYSFIKKNNKYNEVN